MAYQATLYTLISVIIVSLVSLIGIFTISLNKNFKKALLYLIGFSTGALLGDAFFHLIPESIESLTPLNASYLVVLGILVSFILEKFIHWHHCHNTDGCEEHTKPFAYVNLFGDGLHNFIDGLIIASSYLVDIRIGIATTIAVILHEIPQEIGDFAVLLHAGIKKGKALFYNFLTALTAILGAIVALVLKNVIVNIETFLLPFAAGGFIYIASTDLLPELHKETTAYKSLLLLISLVAGLAVMWALLFIG